MKVAILPEWIKQGYLRTIGPVISLFIKLNLNPNWFTTVGLILSCVSAYEFAIGNLRMGGVLMLVAGTFDIIDGQVARHSNRATRFGALYDSTLDRYAEVIMFFGLAFFFVRSFVIHESMVASVTAVAVSVALGGSMMVSYVRARAEGLGFECKVGMMQRPERIVVLGIGALIHIWTLIVAITIVAIFANLTAAYRLYHVWRVENGRRAEAETLGS